MNFKKFYGIGLLVLLISIAFVYAATETGMTLILDSDGQITQINWSYGDPMDVFMVTLTITNIGNNQIVYPPTNFSYPFEDNSTAPFGSIPFNQILPIGCYNINLGLWRYFQPEIVNTQIDAYFTVNSSSNLILNKLNDISIGDNVFITGSLTDKYGKHLLYGDSEQPNNLSVIINITNSSDDEVNSFIVHLNQDNTTYNYNYQPDSPGEYHVTVTYTGYTYNYNDVNTQKNVSTPIYFSNTTSESFTVTNSPGTGTGTGTGTGNGNGLGDTGFPLIILLVLSVTGLVYWRKK
jgi:hypothetical protein